MSLRYLVGNIFICLFVLTSLNGYSIIPLNINQVDPYLDDTDRKKLEKANKYDDEANSKTEESNAIYLQISELQAMSGAEPDSKTQKKIDKLESEAINLQIEALELNEKGNEIRKDVYKSKIDDFLKDYTGNEASLTYPRLLEEQANEEFYKTTQLRSGAASSENEFDKYIKLLEAQEAELKGIEHQQKALEAYMNVDDIETVMDNTTQPDDITTSDPYLAPTDPIVTTDPIPPTSSDVAQQDIVFDEYQMSIIRKIQNNEIPQPEVNIYSIDNWDMENVQEVWYEYAYDIVPESKERATYDSTQISDTLQEYIPPSDDVLAIDDKTYPHDAEVDDKTYQPDYTTDDKTYQPDKITDDQTYQPDVGPADIYSGKNIIFRVQIAADRTPLSQSTLRKIYYGQHNVAMIEESGWYKYSIGDFTSYNEANRFRNSSGVGDAFIVAYKDGIKMDMAYAKRGTEYSGTGTPHGQITYKVQVAAAKNAISEENIKNIYTGSLEIGEIQEEGWYKYSIGSYTSYEDAASLRDVSGVSDAFVVAYINGRKLDLFKSTYKSDISVKRYAEISGSSDIIFGVQIAASHAPISIKNLSRLYKGKKTIIETTDGVWFRYRIDLGRSIDEAKQFRDECNIKGAFVVAHQNGNRIRIKDAIDYLKTK